jgi:hypothetical protein
MPWSVAQFAEEDDNGNVGTLWAMLLADGGFIKLTLRSIIATLTGVIVVIFTLFWHLYGQ